MKIEGTLQNFAFSSCPNGAYKQSFGKSIGSVLKLSLDEVRELSSGIKKFIKSTEFILEGSLNERKTRKKQKQKQKKTQKEKASSKIEKLVQFKFM